MEPCNGRCVGWPTVTATKFWCDSMTYALSNVLLDMLPSETARSLSSQLMRVPLPAQSILYEANKTPRHVHFLTSGIASAVNIMSDGQRVEVTVVGREGAPQGIHLLAPISVPTRCFMQIAGTALRMDYHVLLRMLGKDEHLRRALLAYAQYQNLMTAQFVACGRLHGVRERLTRRLLMLQDRMGDGVLKLTQASLAGTLGAQRTTVTAVCGELEHKGILAHERGTLRILQRSALEAASCECYRVTRRLLESLYAEAGQRVDYPAAG